MAEIDGGIPFEPVKIPFQSVPHFMIRVPFFLIGAITGIVLFFKESFIVVGVILLICLLIYKVIAQLKCLVVSKHKKWEASESALIRNQILIGLSGIVICINLQRILVTFVKCDPDFFNYSLFFLSFISTVLYNIFVYECELKYETDQRVSSTVYLELFALHIVLLMVMIKIVLTHGFYEKDKGLIICYYIFVELFSVFITLDLYGVLSGLLKLKDVDGVGQPAGNAGNNLRLGCEDCKNRELQANQTHPKINCKVCRLEYSEARIPRNLRECGHTICEKCIETLLEKNQGKFLFCPFCQEVTAVKGPASLLQKNYGILEIINNLKN